VKFVQYFLPFITLRFERIGIAIAAIVDSVLEYSHFVIPFADGRRCAATLRYALVDDRSSMNEGDHRLQRIPGDAVRNDCNRRWDEPSSYYNDRPSYLPYHPEHSGMPLRDALSRR
jgi:hypothetical protein